MVRVAIDGTCWANQRGYGRYMREVLTELWRIDRDNEYVMITDSQSVRTTKFPENIPMRIAELGQSPVDGASAGSRRRIGDMFALGKTARAEPCDVFFFSSVFSYFPYFGRGRVVLVIHDAIAERHPREVFPDFRSRMFWNIKTRLAIHEADQLVTVSEYSRREIADVFRLSEDSISVVSESASPIFVQAFGQALDAGARESIGLGEDEKYFIYVGGFAPHKNLDRMIRAYGGLCEAHPEEAPALVMVGEIDKQTFMSNIKDLQGLIDRLGLSRRVHFPGFVADEELAPLYANAVGLLLPSLREGFGLPAVEAAAAGTPVIATRNSPLPEVLEGGGIFVEPTSDGDLADALKIFTTQSAERDKMARAARERATALSWTDSARALKRCFEETADAS